MTTEKIIKEIFQNTFGAAYLDAIKNMYQRNVEEGAFDAEETEYLAGIAELKTAFTPQKAEQLAAYESTCSTLREYAARYGFLAGLYCGFKQYFTTEYEDDGGFTKYVNDNIGRVPKMKRHKEYYEEIKCRNALARAMEDSVNDETRYHIVSVECAWDQRIYSASIDGFYLGYRTAVAILERVEPQNWPALQMERKVLMMEHRLGFIMNYDDIERYRKRNAQAAMSEEANI